MAESKPVGELPTLSELGAVLEVDDKLPDEQDLAMGDDRHKYDPGPSQYWNSC